MEPTQTLASQRAAIEALAELAEAWPTLPGAYFVLSRYTPGQLSALLDSPADVEAWRTALRVDPADVELDALDGKPMVEFVTRVAGVQLRVWATGAPVAERKQAAA